MLLTLTTTHSPATDLGYLLYKNPARRPVQRPRATAALSDVQPLPLGRFMLGVL